MVNTDCRMFIIQVQLQLVSRVTIRIDLLIDQNQKVKKLQTRKSVTKCP